MLDIHCHIIPGVDDGSGSMSDSIEMAEISVESGVTGIVATPHCNIPRMYDNYRSEELDKKFLDLSESLKKMGIPVELYCGQEVFLCRGFRERLKNGDFITLNNSRYLLVEFDAREDVSFALNSIEMVVAEGYVPVAAHPERYGFVVEDPAVVNRIRSLGALIQLNRGSLTGKFGRYIQMTAQSIVENRLADFVASDAHSQYSRTPSLADVHELICENYSYDYAEVLLETNPRKLINNEAVLKF